jgi:transcriptional regulator with XRE-family HTH domain
MGIVERIKEMAFKRKKTIAEIERELNLGNGTIRRWNNTLPSGNILKKVAEYFGVTMDFLVNGNDLETSKAIMLGRQSEKLTDEQYEAVFNLIQSMINKKK